MSDSYITVLKEAHDEVVIQKSRFIGYACPCASEEEAVAFLQSIREMHREARHCCYAYVIGANSGILRYSDDGEPGGTAGLPIYNVLKNEGVVNCCVVVVRSFGGILLGTGGLSRAYSQGCKIALEAAGLARMERSVEMKCRVPYSLWNPVQYAVQKSEAKIAETSYGENVEFSLIARKKDLDASVRVLMDITDGKIETDDPSEKFIAWDLPS